MDVGLFAKRDSGCVGLLTLTLLFSCRCPHLFPIALVGRGTTLPLDGLALPTRLTQPPGPGIGFLSGTRPPTICIPPSSTGNLSGSEHVPLWHKGAWRMMTHASHTMDTFFFFFKRQLLNLHQFVLCDCVNFQCSQEGQGLPCSCYAHQRASSPHPTPSPTKFIPFNGCSKLYLVACPRLTPHADPDNQFYFDFHHC